MIERGNGRMKKALQGSHDLASCRLTETRFYHTAQPAGKWNRRAPLNGLAAVLCGVPVPSQTAPAPSAAVSGQAAAEPSPRGRPIWTDWAERGPCRRPAGPGPPRTACHWHGRAISPAAVDGGPGRSGVSYFWAVTLLPSVWLFLMHPERHTP